MDKQKQIITEVATGLFLLHGFKSITMDTVAQEGHISKKTIYKHFRNKENLIAQVLEELATKIKKMTELVVVKSDNSLESCFWVYYSIFRQTNTNVPLIHWSLKKYYPECYETFYQFLWQILKGTTDSILRDGISKELFVPEIDARGFCYVLTNSLLNITNRTQVIKDEFDIGILIEQTIYYNLRSLLTLSGLEVLPLVKQNEKKFKTSLVE